MKRKTRNTLCNWCFYAEFVKSLTTSQSAWTAFGHYIIMITSEMSHICSTASDRDAASQSWNILDPNLNEIKLAVLFS